MTFHTQYAWYKDGKKQPGRPQMPLPHPQSEEDNVERAGYRTLKQQIQELEDAGALHLAHMRLRYPDPNTVVPPAEEPQP